jgi:hypothetical protein
MVYAERWRLHNQGYPVKSGVHKCNMIDFPEAKIRYYKVLRYGVMFIVIYSTDQK